MSTPRSPALPEDRPGARHRKVDVVELDRTADGFIADDARVEAEHVAVPEAGSLEEPMVGPVDDEATDASWRAAPEPGVQTKGRAGAEERPFGLADERVGPHARHRRFVVGPHDRIVAMSCVLMADHCRTSIAIGDADLPEHRVARERGVVAAAPHVGLDRRALPCRPVLVVTDPEDEVVAVETVGVEVKVGRASRSKERPSRSAHSTKRRAWVNQPVDPIADG